MAIVKAPLIGVLDAEGRTRHLYAGAEVPDFVSADDVKRLKARGLIEDAPKARKSTEPVEDDTK